MTSSNTRPCGDRSGNMEKLRREAGSRSRHQDVDRIKRSMNKASIQLCDSKRHIDNSDACLSHVA